MIKNFYQLIVMLITYHRTKGDAQISHHEEVKKLEEELRSVNEIKVVVQPALYLGSCPSVHFHKGGVNIYYKYSLFNWVVPSKPLYQGSCTSLHFHKDAFFFLYSIMTV